MSTRSKVVADMPLKANNGNSTHMRVNVSYQKGGTNMLHGTEERGGYYVHVKAVEIEDCDGFQVVKFVLFSNGRKRLLREAKRFSQKAFAEVMEGATTSVEARVGKVHEVIEFVLDAQGLALAEVAAWVQD